MNRDQIRKSYNKGIVFGIVVIFLVLIGFDIMAGSILSKLFGEPLPQGAIPSVKYIAILFILIGIWNGWTSSKKSDKAGARILAGLIAGAACGILAGIFGLLLNSLVVSNLDLRSYLPQLSFDNIKLYLIVPNASGIFVLFFLFLASGLAGGLVATGLQSSMIKKFFQSIKELYTRISEGYEERAPVFVKKYGTYLLYLILAVVILVLPLKWGSYWNYVIGTVGLYVIAGLGLNIIVGLSGQLTLGYAAFFAMGAYAVALLNAPLPHHLMWGFWIALIIGILAAIASGVLLGIPTMRLRGDYLAIVTLAFGEIIRILLKSDVLTGFTGGPRGIQDIKGPMILGKPFTSDSDYMYLILAGVIIAIFVYNRLQNSRTGRAWLSIKEDEIAAQATGVNVQNYKLLALCIGAAFAGLAGGIFAARNQFTGPDDHNFMVSVNILSLVIVGGMNSIPGIILGAFTLKGLPEILREFETYRLLAFGALLVVMMLMRPEGLWPSARPNLEKKIPIQASGIHPDKASPDIPAGITEEKQGGNHD
jgi:ABC-type branched-subunit amino acid transport system permease subunit